jgi:hypothetical protein
MFIPSFRLTSIGMGRFGMVDLEGSNNTNLISFGGISEASVLSMKSICWNSNSPGELDYALTGSLHVDTIPGRRVS